MESAQSCVWHVNIKCLQLDIILRTLADLNHTATLRSRHYSLHVFECDGYYIWGVAFISCPLIHPLIPCSLSHGEIQLPPPWSLKRGIAEKAQPDENLYLWRKAPVHLLDLHISLTHKIPSWSPLYHHYHLCSTSSSLYIHSLTYTRNIVVLGQVLSLTLGRTVVAARIWGWCEHWS